MKGFKHTGRGPKSGFSFPSKAGFTHSGTNKQNVKGYTRVAPKKKFATGGMVTAPMSSSSSALTRRTKPVTGFDKEAGGKGPLRPGFKAGGMIKGIPDFEEVHNPIKAHKHLPETEGYNKGGKACYAEGGKVATTGAAIKMMKELMKRGNSAEDAASKAARRYGVSPSSVKAPVGPTGGGGMPAEKQMLARGGMAGMVNRAATAATRGFQQGQQVAPALRKGPPQRALPTPQAQKAPVQMGNHMVSGYGSFGRRPIIG